MPKKLKTKIAKKVHVVLSPKDVREKVKYLMQLYRLEPGDLTSEELQFLKDQGCIEEGDNEC